MDRKQRRISYKPVLDDVAVRCYVKEFYGLSLTVSPKQEVSYNDLNFLVEGTLVGEEEERKFMFKCFNAYHSYHPEFLKGICYAMTHLNQSDCSVECSTPVKSLSGQFLEKIDIRVQTPSDIFKACSAKDDVSKDEMAHPVLKMVNGKDGKVDYLLTHFILLLRYIPGRPFSDLKSIPDELLVECGALVGKVLKTFENCHFDGINTGESIWSLEHICDLETPFLECIKEERKYTLIRNVIDEFKEIQDLHSLPRQVIHGDLSHTNLLISEDTYNFLNTCNDEKTQNFKCGKGINCKESKMGNGQSMICGIIDFTEMNYTCRIFEIAITIAYISLTCPQDPFRCAALILSGYKSIITLTPEERKVLCTLVKGRLAQSLAIGHYLYYVLKQKDDYTKSNIQKCCDVLEKFLQCSNHTFQEMYLDD